MSGPVTYSPSSRNDYVTDSEGRIWTKSAGVIIPIRLENGALVKFWFKGEVIRYTNNLWNTLTAPDFNRLSELHADHNVVEGNWFISSEKDSAGKNIAYIYIRGSAAVAPDDRPLVSFNSDGKKTVPVKTPPKPVPVKPPTKKPAKKKEHLPKSSPPKPARPRKEEAKTPQLDSQVVPSKKVPPTPASPPAPKSAQADVATSRPVPSPKPPAPAQPPAPKSNEAVAPKSATPKPDEVVSPPSPAPKTGRTAPPKPTVPAPREPLTPPSSPSKSVPSREAISPPSGVSSTPKEPASARSPLSVPVIKREPEPPTPSAPPISRPLNSQSRSEKTDSSARLPGTRFSRLDSTPSRTRSPDSEGSDAPRPSSSQPASSSRPLASPPSPSATSALRQRVREDDLGTQSASKKLFEALRAKPDGPSASVLRQACEDYVKAKKKGVATSGRLFVVQADQHGQNRIWGYDAESKRTALTRRPISLGGSDREARTTLSNEPDSLLTPSGPLVVREANSGSRGGWRLADALDANGTTYARLILAHTGDVTQTSDGCIRFSPLDFQAAGLRPGDLICVYPKE